MSSLYSSKILIVDDNSDNLDLIGDFLEDEGYENIIFAMSAKEAYTLLQKHSIDLIILDIMMPEIDGLQACQYIKSKEEYKDIPIIIATAKTDMETLKMGFDAGANDYVRKPITNDIELLARVNNALSLKAKIDYINEMNQTLDLKIKEEVEKNQRMNIMMQEQSKLAAMGEMIGNIAHQWRQPLNALNINIQNLEDDYTDGLIDEVFIEDFTQRTKKIITFMSDTIDDFRNFFRIDKVKSDFSIADVVEDVLNIQRAILQDYNIDVYVCGDDFSIYGFKNEFGQVIMNIISNAKDAIVERGIEDGKIVIELQKNKISITDNGGGIDNVILNRVFEPYFTTKEQGKGTGMGLYMSKVIIENNMNGELCIIQKSDGVTFEITMKE